MSKLVKLAKSIERFVSDGALVAMGTALEAAIPFAAGHELIRQQRRNLTLIGQISDILFDQLIGAGCVSRIMAAWVGNVSAGLGHNYSFHQWQRYSGKKPGFLWAVSPYDNLPVTLIPALRPDVTILQCPTLRRRRQRPFMGQPGRE